MSIQIINTLYGQYIVTRYDGSKDVYTSLRVATTEARKQALEYQSLTGLNCNVVQEYMFV